MRKLTYRSMLVLSILSLFILSSCQQKKEETQNTPPPAAMDTSRVDANKAVVTEGTAQDTARGEKKEITKEKPSNEVNLKGTWSGSFDSRDAVLKITSQNGNSVSGNINIHYREVVNQSVSGTYNSARSTISMKDQLHSKQMGTYNAKLSSDNKSMSGSFTTNYDKITVSFNLKKK